MAKAAEWKPNTPLHLVTSPDLARLLCDLRGYEASEVECPWLPLRQAGTYRGMKVMVDPYFPTNRILIATGELTIPGAMNIISSTGVHVQNFETL